MVVPVPDVSVVIVSWNVAPLLRRCLRSIYTSAPQGPLTVEVFVVDNGSSDGSAQMVAAEFPQARLIANAGNLGFAAANNQALKVSQGRYALLLNPDTELLGAALAEMVSYMEAHPAVGVLGPQLICPDGRVQPSRRRFPTLATAIMESTPLQRFFPHHPALHRYYIADRSDDELQEVDWVVGAALMVRRKAIDRVGFLDERFYMYSEELDWCYRMKRAGWKVVYLPAAKVRHYGEQSSQQNPLGRHIYFQASKAAFFRKLYGPAAGILVQGIIALSYLFQLAEEGLKLLVVGKKRYQRRQYLGLLARALLWQLGLRRFGPADKGS